MWDGTGRKGILIFKVAGIQQTYTLWRIMSYSYCHKIGGEIYFYLSSPCHAVFLIFYFFITDGGLFGGKFKLGNINIWNKYLSINFIFLNIRYTFSRTNILSICIILAQILIWEWIQKIDLILICSATSVLLSPPSL